MTIEASPAFLVSRQAVEEGPQNTSDHAPGRKSDFMVKGHGWGLTKAPAKDSKTGVFYGYPGP